ncbi:MAG: NVEALA domain-containing protein [Prevotella sp.]
MSAISGIVVCQIHNNNQHGLSDLALANIEALSSGEEIIGDKVPCFSSARKDVNRAYVDCASCKRIEGWKGSGTESTCTR